MLFNLAAWAGSSRSANASFGWKAAFSCRSRAPASSSFLAAEEGHVRGLLHPRCDLFLVEIRGRCQLYTARGLAHSGWSHWRLRYESRAADKHQLHMADECARRKAPAAVHSIVGHAPLHRTLKLRQRLGSQSVDTLSDFALRLRQTGDVS